MRIVLVVFNKAQRMKNSRPYNSCTDCNIRNSSRMWRKLMWPQHAGDVMDCDVCVCYARISNILMFVDSLGIYIYWLFIIERITPMKYCVWIQNWGIWACLFFVCVSLFFLFFSFSFFSFRFCTFAHSVLIVDLVVRLGFSWLSPG